MLERTCFPLLKTSLRRGRFREPPEDILPGYNIYDSHRRVSRNFAWPGRELAGGSPELKNVPIWQGTGTNDLILSIASLSITSAHAQNWHTKRGSTWSTLDRPCLGTALLSEFSPVFGPRTLAPLKPSDNGNSCQDVLDTAKAGRAGRGARRR